MPPRTRAAAWLRRMEALTSLAAMLFGLAVVALIVVVVSVALGSHLPLADLVVSIPAGVVADPGSSPGPLVPGTEISGRVDIAITDPTAGQAALAAAPPVAWVLLLLAGALVLRSALGAAIKEPFSERVAARLRRLGWLAVLGSLGCALLETVTTTVLADSVVREDQGWWVVGLDLPLASLLLGLAMFTVAAILQVGVQMRADLEGTV